MEKNTKKIALSIEEMKHLQELGVDTSGASMVWINDNEWALYYDGNICSEFINLFESISAFTLQDILELLPKEIDGIPLEINFAEKYIAYFQRDVQCVCEEELLHVRLFKDISLIDAAYEMLCWCAENGYLKKGE